MVSVDYAFNDFIFPRIYTYYSHGTNSLVEFVAIVNNEMFECVEPHEQFFS
jgi:hypothetical protein